MAGLAPGLKSLNERVEIFERQESVVVEVGECTARFQRRDERVKSSNDKNPSLSKSALQ